MHLTMYRLSCYLNNMIIFILFRSISFNLNHVIYQFQMENIISEILCLIRLFGVIIQHFKNNAHLFHNSEFH